MWESKIKRLEKVPANQLLANPFNARRHPAKQRKALRASLDTMGVVAAVIVNERTGYVLDGHARIEEFLSVDEEALVDVLYVDLDEAQEAQFLATFDYITYMAEFDRDLLSGLLEQVDLEHEGLGEMVADLREKELLNTPDEWPEYDESIVDEVEYNECPECGHRWPK